MKVSVVIPILNSHEIVLRQALHFRAMNLPDSIEFIFVDDGSTPPLKSDYGLQNLRVLYTNDKRAWTQGLARNMGALAAKGEYLLMTDIDHIISQEALMAALYFTGERMMFPRYFAVLDSGGNLTQDISVLEEYGLDVSKTKKRGLYASYHGNTMCIKRDTFIELGMYDEKACTYGYHPKTRQGEDCYFNTKWNHWAQRNGVPHDVGPAIYMFPIGRYHKNGELNPLGLFHSLSQDQTIQSK